MLQKNEKFVFLYLMRILLHTINKHKNDYF
jgi:hypothetical protein